MAHIAETGFATSSFAVKPTVGIGCARMGVVLALLAMEVGAAITITAAVFGAEALLRRPRLDYNLLYRWFVGLSPDAKRARSGWP